MFNLGINGGTWSLTVEMFLYFLFPFIILLAHRSAKILIPAIIFSVLTSLNVSFEIQDYIYANPVFRIGDFMCGIGFYFLKERKR
jgi:peptidoglycan/LPS O-acetylase OafA/YrhL